MNKKLMKAFISVILALAMIAPLSAFLPAAVSAEQEEPIEISTVEDFDALRAEPGRHAVLKNDLTISGSWTPVGTTSSPFSGVFHGCGHTITLDLTVSDTASSGTMVGVFGCVAGKVEHLTVDGSVSVSMVSGYVGPIAANLKDGGSVFYCTSEADVTVVCTKASAIGGIVGGVSNTSAAVDGVISLCTNKGSISVSGTTGAGSGELGSNYTNGAIGGILGFSATSAATELNKCVNEGSITVDGWKHNIGGIVGQTSSNNNATTISITECANKGDITVYNLKGERAAGIIGYVKGGTINYCYNLGMIRAYSDNGSTPSRSGYGTNYGIFGYANLSSGNKLTVKFCYNGTSEALEAEICTLRNPSYGTFQNFYMQGREEYETSINSNAIAGTAGTAFTDADDLTSKLTALSGTKYAEGLSDGWPILAFETRTVDPSEYLDGEAVTTVKPTFTTNGRVASTCSVCGAGEETDGPTAVLGLYESVFTDRDNGKNSVTVLGTVSDFEIDPESADCLAVTISFVQNGTTVKTMTAEIRNLYRTVNGVASTTSSTAASQGVVYVDSGLLFAVRINNVPSAVYTVNVTVEAHLGEATVASVSAEYGDVMKGTIPTDTGIDGLPYFPNGVVSAVYNAGPGMQNDKNGPTAADCREVVVSASYDSAFELYLDELEADGFVQTFSNSVEGSDYFAYAKNGKNYYLYHTPADNLVRIIEDNASTALVTDLSDNGQGTVEPLLYQYALDFTKNNQQTSNDNYWAIDCGMCYVFRLADNSLFLIDGGHMRQSSDEALEALNGFLHEITGTPENGTVNVKGWFLTHPHGDHVYLTYAFLEKYHSEYALEAVYCNFPSYQTAFSGNYDGGAFNMKNAVNSYYPSCGFYKLHTGQTFSLPGVDFEVIFTHEDSVTATGSTAFTDCNNASTVLRATVNGKSVIFLGDISTAAQSLILGRYSSAYLKSDAVQMAHHCINNVAGVYNAVAAPLILCPQSKENVDQNSGKSSNRQAAINAAGDSYRDILYEADYTYKLSFGGEEIAYETAGEVYTVALFAELWFEKPSALDTYSGTTESERPLDASILSGLDDLSSLIIARSANGTPGANANEAPQRLFDGDTATKWCETSTSTPYLMFRTKKPVNVFAYALLAANDTASHSARNPKSWTLWGSADGENWVAIDSVYNGQMNTDNYSRSIYASQSAQSGPFSYFVLSVYGLSGSGTTMQLSELELYGTAVN